MLNKQKHKIQSLCYAASQAIHYWKSSQIDLIFFITRFNGQKEVLFQQGQEVLFFFSFFFLGGVLKWVKQSRSSTTAYTEEIAHSPEAICPRSTTLASNYTPLKAVPTYLVKHDESQVVFLEDVWRQHRTKMSALSLPYTLKALQREAEIWVSSYDSHSHHFMDD